MLLPRTGWLGLVLLSLAACSSGGVTGSSSGGTTSSSGAGGTGGSSPGTAGSGSGGGADAAVSDGGPIGGDRPVTVHVPSTYAQGTAVPLVVMLHGYSASGDLEEVYLQLTAESDKRGFLYAHPDGTVDKTGLRFWNASDGCCNFYGSTVDDSSYLSGVIADIASRFTVDRKRIYLVGHSNGGFMSYRMACDHADQIAAIVSLAGGMPVDASTCVPSEPVSILEVHGTLDTVIAYDGGQNLGHTYPGATTTIADWVKLDGCATTPDTTATPLDLDSLLLGDETQVTRYAAGCKPGGHVELWTISGGTHLPTLSQQAVPSMIDFLYAHPKP